MKAWWLVLTVLLVAIVLGTTLMLSLMPPAVPTDHATALEVRRHAAAPIRLGIIPERALLTQRRRYRALADELEARLGRRFELVTESTYAGVLDDLVSGDLDAAFVGSLMAVAAMERCGARVLVKPEREDGSATYRGVLFVRADSSIRSVEDLAGRSIAMLPDTTAGELFPLAMMHRSGVLSADAPPTIIWLGTHDSVIEAVAEGLVDAGAAKAARLDAFQSRHVEPSLRRIAVSEPVPTNALVLRAGRAEDLGPRLERALLSLHEDAAGREALAGFGAARFVPCRREEYAPVASLATGLDGKWTVFAAADLLPGAADHAATAP